MESVIKHIWVDYIRVFATFWVLLLHSASPLLSAYNELPVLYWMIGNIYDASVRMSVPLFFMLSGYLLLDKDEPLDTYFVKRLKKVVFPLVIWSIFYIFWKAYYEKSSAVSFSSFLSIALCPVYYHLWFLYAIIGIYLFVPILKVIVRHSGNKLLYYYCGLWFFAVSIMPLLEITTDLKSSLDLLTVSGFSGYLILGWLLGRLPTSRKIAMAAGILSLICIMVTVFGTYVLTARNAGIFSPYFYWYQTPNVIFLSLAIFVLMKHIVTKVGFLSAEPSLSIIRSLSSASLGIYLIHAMFLYLLSRGDLGFILNGFQGHPLFSIPLTAVTTFLLSYASIAILRLIPLVRWITPP